MVIREYGKTMSINQQKGKWLHGIFEE